jgi:hypothetical protein
VPVPTHIRPSGFLPPGRLPAKAVPIVPVANEHQMNTHGKIGFCQPHLNLQVVVVSPVPTSIRSALSDPNWHVAMTEEFEAL